MIWEEVHAGDDVATHGDNRRGRRSRPLRCAGGRQARDQDQPSVAPIGSGRVKSTRSTRPPPSSPSVPGNGLPQSHTCGASRTRDRSARWTGPLSCRQVTNRVGRGGFGATTRGWVLPVRGRPPLSPGACSPALRARLARGAYPSPAPMRRAACTTKSAKPGGTLLSASRTVTAAAQVPFCRHTGAETQQMPGNAS